MFKRFADTSIVIDKKLNFFEKIGTGKLIFYKSDINMARFLVETFEMLGEVPHTKHIVMIMHKNVKSQKVRNLYNHVEKHVKTLPRDIELDCFNDVPTLAFNILLYEAEITEDDRALAVQSFISHIEMIREPLHKNTTDDFVFSEYLQEKLGVSKETAEYMVIEREPRYHAYEDWELPTLETENMTKTLKRIPEHIAIALEATLKPEGEGE